MDLSLLHTLRQKMHDATNFQEVWEYFLDNFGEKDEFHTIGEKWPPDKILLESIAGIGKMILKEPDILVQAVLVGIPAFSFVHGWVKLNQHPSSVFYFPECFKGMMSISIVGDEMETRLARFTSRAHYDGLNRSRN